MEISFDVNSDYDRWDTFESSVKEPGLSHYIFNSEALKFISSLNGRVSAHWQAENDILIVGDPRGRIDVSFDLGGKKGPRVHAEGSAGKGRRGRVSVNVDKDGKGKVSAELKPKKEKDKKKKD